MSRTPSSAELSAILPTGVLPRNLEGVVGRGGALTVGKVDTEVRDRREELMQEEAVIREAQATDIAEIVRHRRRMYEDIGERNTGALEAMQASTSAFLEKAIPAGTFRGWLAQTSAGRVVAGGGMMIVPWLSRPADPKPRRAWILNIYTEPEYRRRGIARRLMQTMIEWCRQAGFQSVSLHSSEEGRLLYESLGFKPTQEMKLVLRR